MVEVMRKIVMKLFKELLGILGVGIVVAGNALACECPDMPACAAFSQHEAIFSAKLISSEAVTPGRVRVRFDVDHVYKGSVAKTTVLIFRQSECSGAQWKTGEFYLVLKTAGEVQKFCNKTNLLSRSLEIIESIKTISTETPTFVIGVKVGGISNGSPMRVFVNDVEQTIRTEKDQYSATFVAKEERKYLVRLVFPGNVDLGFFDEPVEISVNRANNKTVIEYRLDFVRNGCDMREILLRDKK